MDLIIKNGTVIDGTGKPGFKADVAVEGDRIKAVERNGALASANGCRVIDAAGKTVCPGIIDPHSHADLTIHRRDHADVLEPLVRQGITTFVGGNCGMSMAPFSDEYYSDMKTYLEGFTARELKDIPWKDTAGFFDHIEGNGALLNFALLAPHGLIRIDAMGMQPRKATNEEISRMSLSLERCMDAGCIGLSTGLQYMPGLQSDTRELVRLGSVLSDYDGMYVSHLRTYMNDLEKAIDELAEVARVNDIRAQVSHLFWVPDMGLLGPLIRAFAGLMIELSQYWTLPMKLDAEIEKQLNRISKMNSQGQKIGVDVMPTTTTFTHLMAYFPPWTLKGDKEEIGERLTSRAIRRKIRRDIEQGDMLWPHTGKSSWSLNIFKLLGWDCTRIMSVVTNKNKCCEGKRVSDLAKDAGKHPFDFICDLLIEEEGRVLVFSSAGRPEDNFTEQSIFAALAHPDVQISTDTILMGFGKPSHLFYGAFPKFFSRYVREKKMLDLPTAVHKTTGLPAEQFNLKQRGIVKEGYFADLLVFDPDTIAPNVDFFNPVGTPSGIDHVLINGFHVLDDGRFDKSRLAGRALRNGG